MFFIINLIAIGHITKTADFFATQKTKGCFISKKKYIKLIAKKK